MSQAGTATRDRTRDLRSCHAGVSAAEGPEIDPVACKGTLLNRIKEKNGSHRSPTHTVTGSATSRTGSGATTQDGGFVVGRGQGRSKATAGDNDVPQWPGYPVASGRISSP